MERALAIETSRDRLGLCLWEGGFPGAIAPRAVFFREARNRHSDWIIPRIDVLLSRLGWSAKSLSAVVVDVGPGSFTGVRIGLTVAKTLGHSLGIPLIGIPSLDVLAAGFKKLSPGDVLACLTPAIPGEVYVGLYRSEIMRPGLSSVERKTNLPHTGFESWPWFPAQNGLILRRLSPLAWMDGRKAERLIRSFEKKGNRLVRLGNEPVLHPVVLAGLGDWAWRHGGKRDSGEVKPLYLQPSWAERRFEAPRVEARV